MAVRDCKDDRLLLDVDAFVGNYSKCLHENRAFMHVHDSDMYGLGGYFQDMYLEYLDWLRYATNKFCHFAILPFCHFASTRKAIWRGSGTAGTAG